MNLSLPLFDDPSLPRPGLPGAVARLLAGVPQASPAATAALQAELWAEPAAGVVPGSAAGTTPDVARGLQPDAARGQQTDAERGQQTDAARGQQTGTAPGLQPDDAPSAGATPPAALHPAVWHAHQLGGAAQRCTPSGFDALDGQLPGGGWPHGVLTELLLPRPGIGELRLLAPVAATRAEAGCVMLFDPPAPLSAWALQQQGLDAQGWLVVHGGRGAAPRPGARPSPRSANGVAPLLPGADVLWALEQSLRSGHAGLLLAWLPLRLPADALRRLQLAAQSHDGPVFIFREVAACSRPSPAPLRLLLQPAGVDGLAVRLLKRRGPPLEQALRLQLPPVLTPQQRAQAVTQQALLQAGQGGQGGLARPGDGPGRPDRAGRARATLPAAAPGRQGLPAGIATPRP